MSPALGSPPSSWRCQVNTWLCFSSADTISQGKSHPGGQGRMAPHPRRSRALWLHIHGGQGRVAPHPRRSRPRGSTSAEVKAAWLHIHGGQGRVAPHPRRSRPRGSTSAEVKAAWLHIHGGHCWSPEPRDGLRARKAEEEKLFEKMEAKV